MAATQPLTRFASFSKSNKKRNNKNNVEYFSDNPAMNTSLDLISKLTAQAMPATVFKVTTAQPPLILSDASWQPRPPLLLEKVESRGCAADDHHSGGMVVGRKQGTSRDAPPYSHSSKADIIYLSTEEIGMGHHS